MAIIAHAAALTDEDLVPFEHGVALARVSSAHLYSVHANAGGDVLERMLDASSVLSRWGEGRSAVRFDKVVHDCCDDPVDTVLDALRKLGPDLVIAGTHQREGILRALIGSKAEAISQNLAVPTLLVPIGVDGFVGSRDGAINLRRMLLPIGDPAAAKAAVNAAVSLGRMAAAVEVELVLLHVGDGGHTPEVVVPEIPGWTVTSLNVGGAKLEDTVIARAADASVVVMATRGHDSLGDVLLGSHTDRVLHRVSCPVLSVPI